jgi:uncharacterized sulfatase
MPRIPLVSLLLALASVTASAQSNERMNVLLIVSDDLNTHLGCYGHPVVKTPHIDRLAARGLRFERAYCQFPLCNPSRASFMTGLRPRTTTVEDNALHFRDVDPSIVTLPQHFKNHGYRTARVGKLYHYGVPNQIGTPGLDDPPSWDVTVNPRGRDKDDEPRIFSLEPGKFGGTVSWLAAEGLDSEQTDGIGAAEAVRLLGELKAAGAPFFLAVGFYRPHTPYVAPVPYFDRYPLDVIMLSPTRHGGRDGVPAPALHVNPPNYNMPDGVQRLAIQAYWASITFMDAQVGRVLDALERHGLAQNTVVAFTSDHGYHLGDHGLWQKMSLFEPSSRVPLVIAVPGAKSAGHSTRALAELVDLYPTLADLCGLPVPPALEGASLRPLFDDPARADLKNAAFTQLKRGPNGPRGHAVRTDRYRYICWDLGEKGRQLYDLQADPLEVNNLAEDPAHAATVARHHRMIMDSLKGAAPARN